MKFRAERHRGDALPVKRSHGHDAFVARSCNGQVETGWIAGCLDHDIGLRAELGGLLRRHGVVETESTRGVAPPGGGLDERDVARAAEPRAVAGEQPDHATPDDDDAIAERHAGVPHDIERRFEIGRQYGALGGNAARQGTKARGRGDVLVTMRSQGENPRSDGEPARRLTHFTDPGVTVATRISRRAGSIERRVEGLWPLPFEQQQLGALADARGQRARPHLPGLERLPLGAAQLDTPGSHEPKLAQRAHRSLAA
jgi:hypothetical protein